MKRLATTIAIALAAAAALAPAAQAAFGLNGFDVRFADADGAPAVQAGSHPYAVHIDLNVNYSGEDRSAQPDGELRDLAVAFPPGLVGDATAYPRCETVDFFAKPPACAKETQMGTVTLFLEAPTTSGTFPVYNLAPPPGVLARFGFEVVSGVPVLVDATLEPGAPHRVVGGLRNTYQVLKVFASRMTLWGNPADPRHDAERGGPVGIEPRPFFTLPVSCLGPQEVAYRALSWEGDTDSGGVLTHDFATPPAPQGFVGCERLGFDPAISSRPTTRSAESGSGLDFDLDFEDEGLKNPEGLAQSDVKRAEVILPEGMTVNPSVGEGLGVCTPAQVARETAGSEPGEGCPQESKIGTLQATSPLISQTIDGSIYLAQEDDPRTAEHGAENPFDSLIALYFVLKSPELGVSVVEPVKVEPDPETGQLVVVLDENAQVPISHFNAHMRTGARAALITPPTCGDYATTARLTPWSDPAHPVTRTALFHIDSGPHGGPCPPGGVAPFAPSFEAGSLNNDAGSFSPFDMRLIREDGEQDMTKFSATLPPGELGSLAGVDRCPDSAVGAARAKQGVEELEHPSCPANSLVGHTLAGAGVGDSLTYVKGFVYLGGPYHGDPLSVIAITPAVAGPFDAGTVVVQEALTLNPRTAEVQVDGANSDPIPHILKGIVLKLRDLRVNVDRPNFTLNPTDCTESSAKSVLFGSWLDPIDPADDRPVDLATRFQAANCLNLGFKPRLALNLKGGTRRGGHPGLKAIYTPRKGDANIKGLVVRLPRSAFLDQAHIRTICTRVQFAAGGGNGEHCPRAARYGYVKAWTPLLDEPLQGPVYLRSSSHKLPDLVLVLHGLVDIEVDIRIDSARGGIRATLEDTPDAPISRVLLRMQGAKKGLIVNSRNLCAHPSRANVLAAGHNGRREHTKPVMRARCGKHKRHEKHRRAGRRAWVARSSSAG